MLNTLLATFAKEKLRTAHQRSKKDGRLRHVVATIGGDYRITLRRPDCGHFWTNGVEIGTWTEGASSGVASPRLLAELGD